MKIPAGMMTRSRSVSRARVTLQDRWFATLDNRQIQVGSERRLLRILGIHHDGREVWIQLTPLDDSDRDFVIRCWHRQKAAEVLANVCVHLASSRSTPHMIDARSAELLRDARPVLRKSATQWGDAAVGYHIQ